MKFWDSSLDSPGVITYISARKDIKYKIKLINTIISESVYCKSVQATSYATAMGILAEDTRGMQSHLLPSITKHNASLFMRCSQAVWDEKQQI